MLPVQLRANWHNCKSVSTNNGNDMRDFVARSYCFFIILQILGLRTAAIQEPTPKRNLITPPHAWCQSKLPLRPRVGCKI